MYSPKTELGSTDHLDHRNGNAAPAAGSLDHWLSWWSEASWTYLEACVAVQLVAMSAARRMQTATIAPVASGRDISRNGKEKAHLAAGVHEYEDDTGEEIISALNFPAPIGTMFAQAGFMADEL